jgi:hypothetical protein
VAEYRGLLLDFGHVILRTPFELHRVVDCRYGLAENIHLIRKHLELD